MSTKRIICTTIALFSCLLFTAFIPDCWGQLTLDTNSSLDEYARDRAWCMAESEFTESMCLKEAMASFDYEVDLNIARLSQCCCDNNLPSCCG